MSHAADDAEAEANAVAAANAVAHANMRNLIALYYNRLAAVTVLCARRNMVPRPSAIVHQRLEWEEFRMRFDGRFDFQRHLRMTYSSFCELLSLIRDKIEIDHQMASRRGGPIFPEIMLYLTLRYCAGGSYSDIHMFTGISTASFYRCMWRTIDAINSTTALQIKFPQTLDDCAKAAKGFEYISSNAAIVNCVAAVDGYHLQTDTPSSNEVANVRSFYSGHYQTYGVNVQAAVDHNCRFVFIGVAGPGVMGDREALNQVSIGDMIENLPGFYCVIGDCAYTPTEHMIPIYRGYHAKTERGDNFNFYASQLRIRIEMAFGLMVKKWGILSRPLTIKMSNIKRLMMTVARLHNFCIDQRLQRALDANIDSNRQDNVRATYNPNLNDVLLDEQQIQLRDTAAEAEMKLLIIHQSVGNPWSHNRDRMARTVESFGLTRPGK
jgi:hypothetical protein